MANLITEKQKKTIRTEYFLRLGTAVILMAALLSVYFLAYVIPYYASVSQKDKLVGDQFKTVINVENKENIGESALRIVTQTLDEIKMVEAYGRNNTIASTNFAKIITSRNANVQINRLSFSLVKKNQIQFLVSGISKNRQGLVTFINDLKTRAGYSVVDSPISDLVRDSNIPFTINIKTEI
jgi:hypothetical protein